MDLDRRTLLQAGGVLAAGGLVAACAPAGTDATVAVEPAASGPGSPSATAAAPANGTGVAQVSDIPVGGGVILDDPAVVITQPVAGEVKAFTAICPHQGCLVSEVVDNEIICPCHGSRFSAVDGAVTSGPATTGLTSAGVALEGGSVVLT